MITKIILAFFMLIGCMNQACINEDDPQGIALSKGDSLPDFSVTLSTGETVSNKTLRGKIPVIVFFNTGCPDCREELPVIQKLWENYQNNPQVAVLAISREEEASSIMSYWISNNFTIPWSAQETKEVYSLFAPSIIPRIYISDLSGKIVFSSTDVNMPNAETLISEIESARQ